IGGRIGVAHYHVGVAGDGAKAAESQGLKTRPQRAQRGRTCDGVAHNVIDLECRPRWGRGCAQNVAGIAIVETAESDKLPIVSQSAQLIACNPARTWQDRIISEVVDLKDAVRAWRATQHHDGGGGGRRGRTDVRSGKAEGVHGLDVPGRELGESASNLIEW